MVHFWPKIKCGGLVSGHDYLYNKQVQAMTPEQDWSICGNGEKQEGAVKGAVDFFVSLVNRGRTAPMTVHFTAKEQWPSWYFRKLC